MDESQAFLERLADADRTALLGRWRERQYERGELIIAHEEESRDVFFVLEGHARATLFSEGGKAVDYRDISPGHIFGELASIDGKRRSASVLALDACRVARLSDTAFRSFVDSQPSFRWSLLSHLSGQVRLLTQRVYEFSTLVVRKRLIKELLRLAEQSGQSEPRIDPAPRHFDLAARISTHREAVSREMSALTKKRFIGKRGRALVLLDVAALNALCSESESVSAT